MLVPLHVHVSRGIMPSNPKRGWEDNVAMELHLVELNQSITAEIIDHLLDRLLHDALELYI